MRWTKEEEELLKESYKIKEPIGNIANKLNRTAAAIRNKAYKLGITNPVNFTNEEIEYIKENYKSYNLREIAKELGREDNYHNICRKARELNLERSGRKKEVTRTRKPKFKSDEERSEYLSKIARQWHKENEHPRGMLGKTHSKEYRRELSKRVKEDWQNRTPDEIENIIKKRNKTRIKNKTLTPKQNITNPYSYAKGGKRTDLNNQYFRSSWEANIARLLNYKGYIWKYEPKQFIFKNVYRKPISYTPDFYIEDKDLWIEVKGWMDERSKLSLKRFRENYPEKEKKLILINEDVYKEIEEEYKDRIEGWE